MKYLLADIGNTRNKLRLWEGNSWSAWEEGRREKVDYALAAVTGKMPDWRRIAPETEIHLLNYRMPLPIKLDYLTPETLGADRLAAACGAWVATGGKSAVIIDAGTCITIDYLDAEGIYRGGAILPGLEMKFKALNAYTEKLPLIGKGTAGATAVCGRSTEESIRSGVIRATRFEVEGYVDYYRRKDGNAEVFLTGGDAEWLSSEGMTTGADLVMLGLKAVADLIYESEIMDKE